MRCEIPISIVGVCWVVICLLSWLHRGDSTRVWNNSQHFCSVSGLVMYSPQKPSPFFIYSEQTYSTNAPRQQGCKKSFSTFYLIPFFFLSSIVFSWFLYALSCLHDVLKHCHNTHKINITTTVNTSTIINPSLSINNIFYQ